MTLISPHRPGSPSDRAPHERPLQFREGRGAWLGPEAEGDLQRLLEACRDDLRLATGGEPDVGEAREMLRLRPAGVADEQRLALGVYGEAGALLAALDVYRDYPRRGSWLLAVLLVHPDARGRGLATGMLARLERLAALAGGESIHVIAPGRNPATLQLFRRAGYASRREVALPLGGRTLRGYHLVRELPAARDASPTGP